jgi:excisionase family DNA binding protein
MVSNDPAVSATPRVPIVLTVSEVAALMRVAEKTVYKYKDCDGLPFHQLVKGGAVRFYQHEVLEWMTRHSR